MRSLDGEVHVYRLNLAEDKDMPATQAWLLLDDEERERAGRIRHEPTRRAFVRVRAGLRVLLGGYLACDPTSIRFDLGAKGKPRLAGTEPDQGLVFNVSHSGDCGLLAFALDVALGVDVERIRAMSHQEAMAERCFAVDELAWWRALPEHRRQIAFFALWSCKEAFVKATGEGITLGLESCVVDLSGSPRLVSIPLGFGAADAWRLAEIEAREGYGAAVCYRGEVRHVRLADHLPCVNTL